MFKLFTKEFPYEDIRVSEVKVGDILQKGPDHYVRILEIIPLENSDEGEYLVKSERVFPKAELNSRPVKKFFGKLKTLIR